MKTNITLTNKNEKHKRQLTKTNELITEHQQQKLSK